MLRRKDLMCRFVATFARTALSPFYRIEVIGRKRLPEDDAFILLPKHQRWQDIPVIAIAAARPLYYIAKYELFTNRLSGWFLESLGGIPLNREQPMKSRGSIKAMLEALRRGEAIVLFPEGTYYKNVMGPGKSGMLRLISSRMSFPLVPAGVQYHTDHARTIVRVSFGDPIYPVQNVSPDTVLAVVMQRIAALSGLGQTGGVSQPAFGPETGMG